MFTCLFVCAFDSDDWVVQIQNKSKHARQTTVMV